MNGFLLDTNVISELRKPAPNAGVVAWIESVREDTLFLSSLTFGEIRRGIEVLVDAEKRASLERWLVSDVASRFAGRIIDVDSEVADRWGRLEAVARSSGGTLPAIDALIAATALGRGLDLVTRNVRDFARTGVRVVDPWN